MAGYQIKVEGLEELRAKFATLALGAEKNVMRKGMRAGARVVVEAARSKARVRTGRMKRNIASVIKVGIWSAEATIGFKRGGWYGIFHERGTSKMGAQPMLRPALDEQQGAVTKAFAAAVEAEIRRVAH